MTTFFTTLLIVCALALVGVLESTSPKIWGRTGFQVTVRTLSALVLIATVPVVFCFFFPPAGGLDFGIHILLCFSFFAQLAIFIPGVLLACLVAAVRHRLRCTAIEAALVVLASGSLFGEWLLLPRLHVDPSSIP